MKRILVKTLPEAIGSAATIAGSVVVRRDHGKLIFLDVRDRSGTVQVVVSPKAPEALEVAKDLRAEWVISVNGEVKARPENMKGEGPLVGVELAAQAIQ